MKITREQIEKVLGGKVYVDRMKGYTERCVGSFEIDVEEEKPTKFPLCPFCREPVNMNSQPWDYYFPDTVFHLGCAMKKARNNKPTLPEEININALDTDGRELAIKIMELGDKFNQLIRFHQWFHSEGGGGC